MCLGYCIGREDGIMATEYNGALEYNKTVSVFVV